MREVSLGGRARETGVRLQLAALCLEIHRLLAGGGAPPPAEPALAAHPAALRARECMESQPGRPWRLNELAALAGVSASHLGEVFRREYGEPPARYLRRRRLERARELLRAGDRPVTRIALDLGFASSQHFAGAYKQHFGLTPREQRGKS
jgi:transcriptional regulator GlxA family with amidase domain